MPLTILPVEAFADNYIWLITTSGTNASYIVDPGDAAPVLKILSEQGLNLTGILVTHQHPDHIGGIPELLDHYPGIPVIGPEDISLVNTPVKEGDNIHVLTHRMEVIAVPGHTLNHLAFYVEPLEDEVPLLFCGDTLFAAGCGRLFEGTPKQMLESLEKLAALPDDTRIYCAHEYTLNNLAFARTIEPDNKAIEARLTASKNRRGENLPTIPSTLSVEKLTNPFLRSANPSVKESLQQHLHKKLVNSLAVFTATRQLKDNF